MKRVEKRILKLLKQKDKLEKKRCELLMRRTRDMWLQMEHLLRQRKQNMYSKFIAAYPNVKPEEIPVEVWREVKKGISLLNAYEEYLNTKKESAENEESNNKRSQGI